MGPKRYIGCVAQPVHCDVKQNKTKIKQSFKFRILTLQIKLQTIVVNLNIVVLLERMILIQ